MYVGGLFQRERFGYIIYYGWAYVVRIGTHDGPNKRISPENFTPHLVLIATISIHHRNKASSGPNGNGWVQ